MAYCDVGTYLYESLLIVVYLCSMIKALIGIFCSLIATTCFGQDNPTKRSVRKALLGTEWQEIRLSNFWERSPSDTTAYSPDTVLLTRRTLQMPSCSVIVWQIGKNPNLSGKHLQRKQTLAIRGLKGCDASSEMGAVSISVGGRLKIKRERKSGRIFLEHYSYAGGRPTNVFYVVSYGKYNGKDSLMLVRKQ